MIGQLPRVDSVPYDVNFVWRFGSEGVPHDELRPEGLAEKDRRRIIRYLESYRAPGNLLVEKTVGNSLRVPYVRQVLPRCRLLHLVRDGWDVIESAHRQWLAPPDLGYLLRKTRAFPWPYAPRYAWNHGKATLRRLVAPRAGAVPVWGPRYEGIEADLAEGDVLRVCARQWCRCVAKSLEGLRAVHPAEVLTVKYEEFVTDPASCLGEIAGFIGIEKARASEALATREITRENLGKGRRRLSDAAVRSLSGLVEPVREALHYPLVE
jgi:hypothetical protein